MGLKKDSKGNLTEVTPLRSRKGSIYKNGANETFKISRSKFSSFLDCKRCFYLDRVKGLKDPGMPGWSLNVAVDELLKKEFDLLREQKKPHPIFKKHNLNFIPFQHEKMDHWRNSLKIIGIQLRWSSTLQLNLRMTGQQKNPLLTSQ